MRDTTAALAASLLCVFLTMAADAQAQTDPPRGSGFRQDAIVGGQRRQPTTAEVLDRARAPGSPLKNRSLVDEPAKKPAPRAKPATPPGG